MSGILDIICESSINILIQVILTTVVIVSFTIVVMYIDFEDEDNMGITIDGRIVLASIGLLAAAVYLSQPNIGVSITVSVLGLGMLVISGDETKHHVEIRIFSIIIMICGILLLGLRIYGGRSLVKDVRRSLTRLSRSRTRQRRRS